MLKLPAELSQPTSFVAIKGLEPLTFLLNEDELPLLYIAETQRLRILSDVENLVL